MEYDIKMICKQLNVNSVENITCEWTKNPTYIISRNNGGEMVLDCGKGITKKDAFLSALFEAIERYSAETFQKFNFEISGNTNSFKNVCFPQTFNENVNTKERLIKYVKGTDLLHNIEAYVPLECVKFPDTSDFNFVSTIGLASGTSIDGAILHAIYEVIEHDTLGIAVYSKMPAINIFLSEEDGSIYDIWKFLLKKGIDIEIKYLPNMYNIPTILVLFTNIPAMPGIKVAGIGSNIDIKTALVRALTECEQSACFWYKKFLNRDMKEGIVYHPDLVLPSLLKTKVSKYKISDFEKIETHNIEDEIEIVKKRLGKYTDKIIMVNITNEKVNIPAVRIIIPNFENSLEEKFVKSRTKTVKNAIKSYLGEI